MSRIGKLPIQIPEGVAVEYRDKMVMVKGPLGELTQKIDPDISVEIKNDEIRVLRPTDQKRHKAMHGLYRSLVNNMVVGVSKGFEIKLELVGVGYRAEASGQLLDLYLGYSHNFVIELPQEIKVETKTERRSNPIITLKSYDKQLLGHVAAKIRSLRKPEPYKGKGIRYVGEQIRRKAGKTASV